MGFTPSTAVRANIDTRTGEGEVGAAIGQGALQLTEQAIRKEKVKAEQRRRIEEKRRQMQDANSGVIANKLRDTADTEFETFKLTNPQETWEAERQRQATEVGEQIGQLDFSPDAAGTQALKSEAYTEVESARALTQATRQLRTDTIASLSESMTDAFRSGDDVRIAESARTFADNGANMGKDKVEVLSDINIAREAGEKLRREDAISVQEDLSAGNPEGRLIAIEAEQVSRSAGNEPSLGWKEIDDSDLIAIKKYTKSVAITNRESNTAKQAENTSNIVLQMVDSKEPDSKVEPVTPADVNEALRRGDISLSQRDNLIKRLETPKIETARQVQADLYTKSLDIWRGTGTKAEFDTELNKQSKNLDDGDYKTLAQSAANTLKSSQAEALTRADTEARRQLVDFAEEDAFAQFISDSMKGLAPDAAKLFEDNANEERQLQFWSLSRYNAEMRQWIEDNPTKVGKDFFQQSESVLHEYWNKSIDEIKVLRAEREALVAEKKVSGDKQLDAAGAQRILKEAGGDKTKARELARQRGFTF